MTHNPADVMQDTSGTHHIAHHSHYPRDTAHSIHQMRDAKHRQAEGLKHERSE